MKKKILFVLVLIFAACSSSGIENIDVMPDLEIGIPLTKNGEILEVTSPMGWNSYKTENPVTLMINNVSNKKITLKNDYGIKIFTLIKGKWEAINNQMVYINTEDVLLDAYHDGDPVAVQSIMLLPEISSAEDAYLRIFIVGKFTKDNDDTYEQFSTYIDVKLSP
jgi:hypothetical protein